MPPETDSTSRTVTDGGVAGNHPSLTIHPILVGPSTNGEFNAIEETFVPEACVRLDDVRFEFDSSFIGPEASTEFVLLSKLIKDKPNRPASIFGHADPSGDDDYNKRLSGRRAQAMYALLTRKTEMWESLFKNPIPGGDTWGNHSVQLMLQKLNFYTGPLNGVLDAATQKAVRDFQGSPAGAGLKVDGDPGPKTREKLFKAYMDAICVDGGGKPFQLDPVNDFLARGADPDGKGDFQGCSEFNPDLVFSQSEAAAFQAAANKTQRNKENQPNRRVVIYLFRQGSKISPTNWPCPRAKEGVADCRKRFFSDGEKRRSNQAIRREFKNTKDTFACRFYDRISTLSPCEGPPPLPIDVVGPIIIVEDDTVTAGGASSLVPSVKTQRGVAVVKKTYTNPKRTPVTLKTDKAFTGTGTFTSSSNLIDFFTQATGGTKITFAGGDNVFQGSQLKTGVKVFAQAVTASASVDDVVLTLTLSGGTTVTLPPATAKLTAVDVILDICQSRTTTAADPTPLAQPPVTTPPAGTTATDKLFGGRFIHVQDPGNQHGRAMLIVRQVKPSNFTGNLVLAPRDAKVRLFLNENPTPGEKALVNPHVIPINTIPADGLRFFAQGATVSSALADTGVQLGIQNIEPIADRVGATVVRFTDLVAEIASTAANTNRLNNSPIPASKLTRAPAAAAIAAANFDVDFTANRPLVLIEGSVPATGSTDLIKLSVKVQPAGIPVSWGVQRDIRLAPNGDDASIISLSPNAIPTLTPDGTDRLKATLNADAVGSFHIRPFVDCNGTNRFDLDGNGAGLREPFIIMNLVLIRVGGVGSTNSSRAQPGNIAFTPANPTAATGVGVSTGRFRVAQGAPATAAVHNDATVAVIGGGPDGRRGLNDLFAGWVNNELAVATSPTVPPGEDVVCDYVDTSGAAPVTHQRISVWTSTQPGTVFTGATGPTLVSGPVLDTTNFGNEGTGGNRAVGTEGAIGPPLPITKRPRVPAPGQPAIGETWRVQMWDSPGDNCPAAQGKFPGRLTAYRFNLDFSSTLCFWTNFTGAPGPTPGPITGAAPPTPDAACCLYSMVLINTWRIRISFTFNPVTGASTAAPGNTVALTQDPNPTQLARPARGVELRAPISLRLLATDARN